MMMIAGFFAVTQSSCSDLWSSSLVEDPRNCVLSPAVCGDLEECDYSTETCKPLPPPSCPAISFESITPTSGSRKGGTKVTITGSGFQGDMRVEIDGTPLENVVVEASVQLSGTLGSSVVSCGPSAVTLISSCFERVSKEAAFAYSLDPLTFDDQPITLPAPPGTQVQQLVIDELNSDGDPDIIGIESATVRSFFSDGSGSFTTSTPLSLGGSLFQAASGDLNGDKFTDLIISDDLNPRLWFLVSSGKGSFSPLSIPMPEPIRGVVSQDTSGDGIADVLAVGKSGTLYQLLGSSSGLTGPDIVASGLPTSSMFAALADLNANFTTRSDPDSVARVGYSDSSRSG
jgi:hypothetical protein